MLSENLLRVLHQQYLLFLKSQLYHWNVTGPNFLPLHELFEDHYKALLELMDTTAEHIRSLGSKIPSNIHMLRAHPIAEAQSEHLAAEEMLKELIQAHQGLEETLNDAFETAENLNDQVVCDFIVDCLTFHRKAVWMLRSSLNMS
jgi:starvation-inducible DNA-binding protein